MKLRVIHTTPSNGFYNMAVDEAILIYAIKNLANTEEGNSSLIPTLRFYTFSPPAITIGKFQSIQDIEITGIDIVRRITGGRAILHDGDLTYSLVVHEADTIFGGTSFNGYKSMSLIFRDALRTLGVKAELIRIKHTKYFKSTACFNSASLYELQVGGKKILGSAQCRRDRVILQQGSLILNQSPKFKYQKWGQVGLNQIAGHEFKIEEIIMAVKEVIKNMGINIIDGVLTSEELELANNLLHNY